MISTALHFQGQTVSQLKARLKVMGVTGYSRMRKVELVVEILARLDMAHGEAIEMDAEITEAYAAKAEAADLMLSAYLACVTQHRKNGQTKVGGFWNCCNDNPSKVIIWDDGAKQAVCKACASAYTGTVEDMPLGEVVTCETCQESHLMPLDVEVIEKAREMDYAVRSGTTEGMPFDVWRNGYLIMSFKNVDTLRRFLNMGQSTTHTHDLNRREVGMSGCAYGCKIYRCESCGHDEVIHNATYGCRTR